MTPENAALLGALVGGAITLIGTFLTGALNIWLQWLQTRWALKSEAKKELNQKQLAALQKCVQLIDFLLAAKNVTLGKGGQDAWTRIRLESLSDGALFPPALSDDFAKLIQKVLLMDSLAESVGSLDYQFLESFRKRCVTHVHKER